MNSSSAASSRKARKIERGDLLSLQDYMAKREALRRQIIEIKRRRRVEVGPFATFYFECYETMLRQIQEMLYIEKGGEEQIKQELAAYNPLIPQGSELVATLMFEIEDPERRAKILSALGHIERTIFLQVGDDKILAKPEEDQERTNEAGKTSSVHFLRFPFLTKQIAAFRKDGMRIILGMDHPQYAHMAIMPEIVRVELAKDFD